MESRALIGAILSLTLITGACREPVNQANIAVKLPDAYLRFDLNKVCLEELLEARSKIDGLTEDVARNITKFRERFVFRRVEDLLAVDRIGEKTFLKIRRHFYVKSDLP